MTGERFLKIALLSGCALMAGWTVAHAQTADLPTVEVQVPTHKLIHIAACSPNQSWKVCSIITMTGKIEQEDGAKFIERTKDIVAARVDMSGPGGSVYGSILIGQQVRAKGFSTRVPDGLECDSACAYVWVAGKDRTMGNKSILMWHAPYMGSDPTAADGTASVAIGMYLANLGYTYSDVLHMIGHGPGDAHVTFTDAAGKLERAELKWNVETKTWEKVQ